MSSKQAETSHQQAERRPSGHQAEQAASPALALLPAAPGQIARWAGDLPNHPTSRPLRQAAILQMQRQQGNASVQRFLAGRIQRQDGGTQDGGTQDGGTRDGGSPDAGRPRPANPGGAGPGTVANATESPYDVTGSTLPSLVTQLHHFGNNAALTTAPLGLNGNVTPERRPNGSYRVQVQWAINGATVELPRWIGYDNACTAAQTEWDRFLRQTRAHEQAAHVDAARTFVQNLGPADTVITGATIEALQTNLAAKQQALAARLQTIHDACDHGASIDAILHQDRGSCS